MSAEGKAASQSSEEWSLDDGTTPEEQLCFRRVMGQFATGITVISTSVDGEVSCMTANAFMAGSLVPPLCVVSIGKTARMHDLLRVGGNYSVSILGKEQVYLANHFSGRPTLGLQPEFDDLAERPTLARAIATIATDIVDTADCGDHTLFIGRIVKMRINGDQPLLFCSGRYATVSGTPKIEEIEPPGFW